MEKINDNKLKLMEDEMSRFEEELGLPNGAGYEFNNGVMMLPTSQPSGVVMVPQSQPTGVMMVPSSQPFVLGTNTFSQAQQKILQINQVVDPMKTTMFIPNQVLHNQIHASFVPPPPPPPPPGLQFPPRIPFGPCLPGAPFPASMMMQQQNEYVPPSPWMQQQIFRRQQTAQAVETKAAEECEPEKKTEESVDSEAQVVLSATPKLYTQEPKQEKEKEAETVPVTVLMENMMPEHTSPVVIGPDITTITAAQAASLAKKKDKRPKKFLRVSGGQTWEDPTLSEWEDGDFRLFCGDLGNDVTDELLTRIFSRYPSFLKARVIRDKRTNKTKGFGFISFKDPQDFIRASKEMNGRYVGSRPIKLRKSCWKNRSIETVKKKEKEKAALIALLTGK